MPGVTPSKRAQTNPKSILQRPQGSQKKNMSPGARSPGQGGRFGRTSPPATPQRGNSSPATGKGAGKSPGGEQLVALSRARQAMGLVEKTMLNSEPGEKILPPGTDQEGSEVRLRTRARREEQTDAERRIRRLRRPARHRHRVDRRTTADEDPGVPCET